MISAQNPNVAGIVPIVFGIIDNSAHSESKSVNADHSTPPAASGSPIPKPITAIRT